MSTEERPLILVVDDNPENLDVIKGTLSEFYSLRMATNGETALRLATTEPPPDLVLLDIMMPGMDGYAVCRRLKADPLTAATPVIFVTALGSEGDELAGLHAGAVDFITKPIVPSVLRARVATHSALVQARRDLEARNHQLARERELIQEIVLRMVRHEAYDGRFLRHATLAPEATSGDILLAAFRPDGAQHVLLGDFTGHGLAAAVGGPLIAELFYGLTRAGHPLAEVLDECNRVLRQRFPVQIFMAAGALEIAPDRRRARCYVMGLPAVLWWRQGREWTHLHARQPPLGITGFDATMAYDTAVGSRDRFYLLTDGLGEAENAAGRPFGQARLEALLAQTVVQDRPLRTLMEAVREYSADGPPTDDMSLVEVAIGTLPSREEGK